MENYRIVFGWDQVTRNDYGPMKWNEIGGSRVRGLPMILHLE